MSDKDGYVGKHRKQEDKAKPKDDKKDPKFSGTLSQS